jgi:DNA-binding GntR family transcriptional regulator
MDGVPTSSLRIDRSSFQPAYVQVAAALRNAIATGAFRPGDQLPTEPELCRQFDVSSITIRKAVRLLVDEGAVSTEQGRGTYVRSLEVAKAVFDLSELQSLLDRTDVSVRILEAAPRPASKRAARMLQLEEGQRVISIKRLLLEGEEPLLYNPEFVVSDPHRPVVEMELGVSTLRGLFEGARGIDLAYGDLVAHASGLHTDEAKYLQSRAGEPAWVIEHVFYDFAQRPVTWGRFICTADRLHLATTIGVKPADALIRRPTGPRG